MSGEPAAEFLQAAIEEAALGLAEGGIPIGAVLVHGGRIVGRGHNRRVQRGSAVLHAEMDALEHAGRQAAALYREATLYTTLSPCAMCSGAVLLYGIPRVVIGEHRTFQGEEDLLRSRGVAVVVLDDINHAAPKRRLHQVGIGQQQGPGSPPVGRGRHEVFGVLVL